VHTSAKARLTSVAVPIRIPDSDRQQNLNICSMLVQTDLHEIFMEGWQWPTFHENFMQIHLEVLAQSC